MTRCMTAIIRITSPQRYQPAALPARSATSPRRKQGWTLLAPRAGSAAVRCSYNMNMPHDVVTFGEAMVRLAPPNFRRLEQATSLDVQVGGAELNTAVGLARLGRSTAWVSRLTKNPLGRLVANSARQAGVSTEHVVWTEGDRVGLYFLEFGAAPRASSVLYDRKGAAIAEVRSGEVQWSI